MKLEKVSDNFYKLTIHWYTFKVVSCLTKAFIEIMRDGKSVISVTRTGLWSPVYLIFTVDK